MPIRLCSDHSQGHGCANPATSRGRCAEHAQIRNIETHPNKGFYDTAKWKNTRRRVLFEQPLCLGVFGESCPYDAIAEHVDHITPMEAGGNQWARANLQGLCRSCHSVKTNRELRTR